MTIVFDYIFVVCIAIGLLLGWKRGLLSYVIKPLRGLFSVTFALLCARGFSEKYFSGFLEPFVRSWVQTAFVKENTESFLYDLAVRLVNDSTVSASIDGGTEFVSALSSAITGKISLVLSLAVLFLAAFIVLTLLLSLFRRENRNNPLGIIDSVLGLAFGGAVVFLLFLGGVWVYETGLFGTPIASQSSMIYPFLQSFNPLEFLQNNLRKN